MNKVMTMTAALALLGLGNLAQADVFNLGAGLTSLETVQVGDAGNAADTRYATSGYGSVGYNYSIGKYEVTTAQYTEFLNAKANTDAYGLYSDYMWSNSRGCKIIRSGESGSYSYSVAADYANRPVNFVSFWDACRFTNWLSNGQGNGDTETGAYTMTVSGIANNTITRNVGWTWAVSSENEWYKAAYYAGGGVDAGYYDYATQSNTNPGFDIADASGNNVNFTDNYGHSIGGPYYRTEVGEFQNSESAYGTFDQTGNVTEWNDSSNYIYRGTRGGCYLSDSRTTKASYRSLIDPRMEGIDLGFRVSSVPEPSSILALLSGLAGIGGVALRRRK